MQIKVLAGNIARGLWSVGRLDMRHRMGETIPLSDLVGVEQVDSDRAGLLGGKRLPIEKRRIQFSAELRDGRRFMATADTRTWQRVSSAAFTGGDGPKAPTWDPRRRRPRHRRAQTAPVTDRTEHPREER